jgi:hypothetical protein
MPPVDFLSGGIFSFQRQEACRVRDSSKPPNLVAGARGV